MLPPPPVAAWALSISISRFYRESAGSRRTGSSRKAAFADAQARELSRDAQRVLQNARRDEDQELVAVVELDRVLEKKPDIRQVAEDRNFIGRGALVLDVNTADHHRAAVLDEDFGRHLFRVDAGTGERD